VLSRFKEGAMQPPPEFGPLRAQGLAYFTALRQANNKTLFRAPALCVYLGVFSVRCWCRFSATFIWGLHCMCVATDNSQWALLVFTPGG
jgi:hypothetical protein